MAKINWVFQDESGTNLNRYIATNVATGEEITFDLSRGGNITIIGTPLNAEKLNSLIKYLYFSVGTRNQCSTDVYGSKVSPRPPNVQWFKAGRTLLSIMF